MRLNPDYFYMDIEPACEVYSSTTNDGREVTIVLRADKALSIKRICEELEMLASELRETAKERDKQSQKQH